MSIPPTTPIIQTSIASESVSGFLAHPDELRYRPGVLILHEGSGLTDFIKDQTRRLAAAGYTAFAPDLFREPLRSRDHALAMIGLLVTDRHELRRRTGEALRWLQAIPHVDAQRTMAVGFCFGGLAALEMARAGQDVKAVVCFHGGLSSRGLEQTPVTAKILVCTGADDPFTPPDQCLAFQEEMTRRRADWQMLVLSQTKHAFMNPAARPSVQTGCAYHATSARRSWQAMQILLDEIMGNSL
jgi:dienelactone hydrolase